MLREEDLRACCFLVADAIRARRSTAAPIPAWLRRTHDHLTAELADLASRTGHETGTGEPHSELIGATEAARVIGVSERHIRRLAADLDGRRAGRAWVFDRRTVTEYARARTE